MSVLLDGQLFTRAELMREVAGSRDNVVDVEDAIESLHGAGLIHVIEGQFLFASQAARRTDELGL